MAGAEGRLLVRRMAAPEPATFFAALAGRPGAFLLDSAARGEGVDPDICRWSFFGCDPFLVLRAGAGRAELRYADGSTLQLGTAPSRSAGTMDAVRELLSFVASGRGGACDPGGRGREARDPDAPPFTAGAVGFLGYDLKHDLEDFPEPRAPRRTDDLWLGVHAAIGAYDHHTRTLWLCSRGLSEGGSAAAADRALNGLERLVGAAVEQAEREPSRPAGRAEDATSAMRRADAAGSGAAEAPSALYASSAQSTSGWKASFTRARYEETVQEIRQLIADGEIYQANLSQRFDADSPGEAWPLYERLRRASPAPFAAFLRCGQLEVLSASPELFLRRRGDLVETRPIKGTRPRGATAAEDARLAAELEGSRKDRAELVMIVDLERNDLSRVCRIGTVEVPALCRLESWAHVHHLVATVRGRLEPGVGAAELLAAAFPGGSITGAPKRRAMEILDRLEPTRRGPWTGAVGWLDGSGDLDLHVAIRTAYRHDGRVWVQAGGGITWPSDPSAEYDETITKARAVAEAVAPGRPFPPPEAGA